MTRLSDAELAAMRGHTPGPLAIDWNVSRLDLYSGDAATLVATIRRSTLSDGIDSTAKANARLFVAADTILQEVIERRATDAKVRELVELLKAARETEIDWDVQDDGDVIVRKSSLAEIGEFHANIDALLTILQEHMQ